MKTRTICKVADLPARIDHSHKIIALGSCFAQNMGEKLAAHKFDIYGNPFGITYNPVSLVRQCHMAMVEGLPEESLYVRGQDEAYYHYDYHSDISATSKAEWFEAYTGINRAFKETLSTADWCIVTLGTAWVYTIGDRVVANCHKQPSSQFTKRLLDISTGVEALEELVSLLPTNCQVLLTVSPVRHVRDGLVDNNRSKARLIEAVHQLVANNRQVHYFPAYELVLDDLRDYRYFGRDLVHPTPMAVDYVWSRLVDTVVAEDSRDLISQVNKVRQAMQHRPRWSASKQHRDFKVSMLTKVQALADTYPHLDWVDEISYFSADQE